MKSCNIENLNALAEENSEKYKNRKPFPYISFENFLNFGAAQNMMDAFPSIDENFYKYDNPLEEIRFRQSVRITCSHQRYSD